MKRLRRRLERLVADRALVSVERELLGPNRLHGFLVGIRRELMLLHEVDGNLLVLNGYTAGRIADVSKLKRDRTFVTRYLEQCGARAVVPEGIDGTDWTSLLESVRGRYPLVMLTQERKDPGVGFVGRVERVGRRRIRLREVDPKARWRGVERLRLKDLTEVQFGDAYLAALQQVAGIES